MHPKMKHMAGNKGKLRNPNLEIRMNSLRFEFRYLVFEFRSNPCIPE